MVSEISQTACAFCAHAPIRVPPHHEALPISRTRHVRMGMEPSSIPRRTALRLAFTLAISAISEPVHALKPGAPSKSSLLRRAHDERTADEQEADRERQAEERAQRLERQRSLVAEAERRRATGDTSDKEHQIEANLRANYYYPTARKRYLPRLLRAVDAMPGVERGIRASEWRFVSEQTMSALEDAVLPMRLYASSLAGQGLSLGATFVQKMGDESDRYEAAVKRLKNAVNKRDKIAALSAMEDMKRSVQSYRAEGHLESKDFGIGDIPNRPRLGSALGNNNPTLYNRNIGNILNPTPNQ